MLLLGLGSLTYSSKGNVCRVLSPRLHTPLNGLVLCTKGKFAIAFVQNTRVIQMKTGKIIQGALLHKQTQNNDTDLQCNPPHVLLPSANVPLRHKFLGRRTVLVAVPANHAPPPLPAHQTGRDVDGERLAGAKEVKIAECQIW